MHLTNYSVNKYNEKFERHNDMDRGSKRSVKSLLRQLASEGHDTVKLWRSISVRVCTFACVCVRACLRFLRAAVCVLQPQ